MTKTPTPTEKSKKQLDNTKMPQKTLITQPLRTDLGRPVGVTTATHPTGVVKPIYERSTFPQCKRNVINRTWHGSNIV